MNIKESKIKEKEKEINKEKEKNKCRDSKIKEKGVKISYQQKKKGKYYCEICQYYTDRSNNYTRHLASKYHISRKKGHTCPYCHKNFSRNFGLKRHLKTCAVAMDELNNQQNQPVINVHHHHHHSINLYFPHMIDINEFMNNLKTSHQLTPIQTQGLICSYRDSISRYSSTLSVTLQENCYNQMIHKNIYQPPKLLPFAFQMSPDNRQLSIQEKIGDQWKITNNPQNLSSLIEISNKQVYDQHHYNIILDQTSRQMVTEYLLHAHSVNSNLEIENNSIKGETLIDCGIEYQVDKDNNRVYRNGKLVGRYVHDDDCPECQNCQDISANHFKSKCWYYIDLF